MCFHKMVGMLVNWPGFDNIHTYICIYTYIGGNCVVNRHSGTMLQHVEKNAATYADYVYNLRQLGCWCQRGITCPCHVLQERIAIPAIL